MVGKKINTVKVYTEKKKKRYIPKDCGSEKEVTVPSCQESWNIGKG